MKQEEEKRVKVSALLDAEICQAEIAHIAGVGICTVQHIAAAKRSGTSNAKRKHGSGSHQLVSTKEFIEALINCIITNPDMFMCQHAQGMAVSDFTICKNLQEHGFKNFVCHKQHLITEAAKEKWLKQCQKLLSSVRNHQSKVKIFSDKKIFVIDQCHNHHNDCWIALDRDDVKGICKTKHPQQVMVLGILASDGMRMDPIFFARDEKCNAKVYYHILCYKVLPWLKENYPDGSYCFQQDGAPAHTAIRVQKFLSTSLLTSGLQTSRPPSSPDLNPLDYFWWSIIESKVNKTPHQNLESLKDTIKKEWNMYPAAGIKKACASFPKRIEAVIKAKGSWIEH